MSYKYTLCNNFLHEGEAHVGRNISASKSAFKSEPQTKKLLLTGLLAISNVDSDILLVLRMIPTGCWDSQDA